MLLNREVLMWLRGGPLPDHRAVEFLEGNAAVFFQAPTPDEEANGKALRAALGELVRSEATTEASDPCERDSRVAELTERER
jgi:hypothetical protein